MTAISEGRAFCDVREKPALKEVAKIFIAMIHLWPGLTDAPNIIDIQYAGTPGTAGYYW